MIFGSNTKIALHLGLGLLRKFSGWAKLSQLNKKFQVASGNKYCENMVPFSDMGLGGIIWVFSVS